MTYLGRPVCHYRTDFSTAGVEHGQLDDHTFDALSGGRAVPWKTTSKPKRTLTLPFLLDGMEEIKGFRMFVAAADGRRLGFWVPVWLTDFELVAAVAAGEDEIAVKWVGVPQKLTMSDQFRHIALITPSSIECYRVESAIKSGDVETLTLDRGLDTAIASPQNTVCCGLLFARFAEDNFELDYINGALARVTCGFVELPTETDDDEHTGSQPLYLYRLTIGATQWRFTNWPISITKAALAWTAIDIEHGDYTQDSELSLDELTLDVATDDPESPFRMFLDPHLCELASLEIFDGDYGEPMSSLPEPFYKGRVSGARFGEKGSITFAISSPFRIGETEIPRRGIQRTCENSLFDPVCGLNADDFDVSGEITGLSASPPYIEAAEFGSTATAESDSSWFALGKVVVGAETRFCVGQSGDRLYLNAAFRSAEVGQQATAWPGCNKRTARCERLGNLARHWGFPYIPNRNPQFEALQTPKPAGGKK